MRCPDCNKFVSFDEPQCELQEVRVENHTVCADVRVVLNCQDCGTELKDYDFNTEHEFQHECKPVDQREADWKPDEDYKPEEDGEESEKFTVEDDGDPTGTDRLETKDRHGKPIKNSRYMKKFYGFEMEVGVKCRCCGEPFGVHLQDEAQASGFNELT